MMIMGGKALEILLFLVLIQFWCMIAASGSYPNDSTDGEILCIESEKQALLTFKQGLVDAYDTLSSWGSEEEKQYCCKWVGIVCDNKTGHVIRLDFHQFSLAGKISSSLLELQHLRYIDLSGNNFNGSTIPKFIGSLSNLTYLDLSDGNFGGTISSQLGNLSYLESLSLGYNDFANVESLEWLSHLSFLKYLDLSALNLSGAIDWVQAITNLPNLIDLNLFRSQLSDIVPTSLSLVNISTSLSTIDLSFTNQTSSVFHWLFNFSSSLVYLHLGSNLIKGSIPSAFGNMNSLSLLDLSHNQLEGSIPSAFGNMTSISFFNLYNNQLEGEIPKTLGTLCSLQGLYLDYNNLNGKLTGFIDNLLHCEESSLEYLSLSHNQITGPFPNLTRFSSMSVLNLSFNRFKGTIPESLGQLSMLEDLYLSRNSLEGVISEAQFSNLFKLKVLDLSFNSLALSFKEDWVPPFQLYEIRLSSCKLGPHFPKWLLSQKSFLYLDISGTEISDSVPNLFWNLPPNLFYLSLSHNQINGIVANSSARLGGFPQIDLSSNHLEGPIPPFLLNTRSLNLSENKFSGPITFLCSLKDGKLTSLDLSSNFLSDELPDCWLNVKDLVILNLASNNFSGKIPPSLAQIQHLAVLDLSNNKLSGKIPTQLQGFNASAYEGNPDLCGAPLPNKCDGEDSHVLKSSKSEKHE